MITEQTERIRRELAGEPTGFDKLLEKKYGDVQRVYDLMQKNSKITRVEIAEKLGISLRTVTRHLSDLRKVYKIETELDRIKRAHRERVHKLRKLVITHPEYSRERLAKELGVTLRTLKRYFKKLELVP